MAGWLSDKNCFSSREQILVVLGSRGHVKREGFLFFPGNTYEAYLISQNFDVDFFLCLVLWFRLIN